MAEESTCGPYRLVAEIGRGGMAEVFLAVSKDDGKRVALKRLRADLASDASLVTMFGDEARIAMALEHENIVRTFEVGEVAGRPYLTMELLDGWSVQRIRTRAKEREIDVEQLLYRAIRDALAGLHHAHEAGVVHRDVGPHNIIVVVRSKDGASAKLVDFGIAKAARRATETTGGVVKGKVRWMAPEQALSLPVDRRADLFSVGVMLWEAATGQPFWPDEIDDVAIAVKLAQGDYPTSPRDVEPKVPAAIDALCKQALARDAAERPASAREMMLALDEVLEPTDSAAVLRDLFPNEERIPTAAKSTRRRAPMFALAIGGLACATVAVVALGSGGERPKVSVQPPNIPPATPSTTVAVEPSASAVSSVVVTLSSAEAAPRKSPPKVAEIIPAPSVSASPSTSASTAPSAKPGIGRTHLDRDQDPWQ